MHLLKIFCSFVGLIILTACQTGPHYKDDYKTVDGRHLGQAAPEVISYDYAKFFLPSPALKKLKEITRINLSGRLVEIYDFGLIGKARYERAHSAGFPLSKHHFKKSLKHRLRPEYAQQILNGPIQGHGNLYWAEFALNQNRQCLYFKKGIGRSIDFQGGISGNQGLVFGILCEPNSFALNQNVVPLLKSLKLKSDL